MKIICRLYSIYIRLCQPPSCRTTPLLPRRPSRCSTSKTHSDETWRDCYLPSPLYENQIGNCFCPWFTSMQTKKLFSYFHVNVFFIGGDKCNQSSSRQGRRAVPPKGRGLLVLSSPGIIKQGNWKWYLIDTAISTGAARAPVPTPPPSPPLSRMPDSLACRRWKEGREWTNFLSGQDAASRPGSGLSIWRRSAVKTHARGESFTLGGTEKNTFRNVTSSAWRTVLYWSGTLSALCILL